MAGKTAILTLRDNLGNAIFNVTTKRLDFPATVPQSRFPKKNMKKPKALMGFVSGLPKLSHEEKLRLLLVRMEGETSADADTSSCGTDGKHEQFALQVFEDSSYGVLEASTNPALHAGGFSENVTHPDFSSNQTPPVVSASANQIRVLGCNVSAPLLFYVDSGAGQCLCSSDSSFVDMTPCMIEITGIAGALQIYGCGTALFLATDASGRSFILRVHNCLFGQGEFNLLSVSQLCQQDGNSVNLSLVSPSLTLRSSGSKK